METIRALLKGEGGEGWRTAETLLSDGEKEEEETLLLFTAGESLVLFVGTVENGEGEEGFLVL